MTTAAKTRKSADSSKSSKSADAVDAQQLLRALRLMRKGDFTHRLPLDQTGVNGELARAFNEVIELNERLTNEFARISQSVPANARTSHAVCNWASGARCLDGVHE